MKFYSILLLTLLVCTYAIEEAQQSDLKCEASKSPFASSAKDCNKRIVDSDKYCCYVKGNVHDGYYIEELNGCVKIQKTKVDNDAFTSYMDELKSKGYEISIDCISSYLSVSLLLLLFIFI